MLKSNYEVEVLINGKPAKEYSHKGKTYIEGREGTAFTIRIRNNSYSRKLFVPTIDGLSVMDGSEGSFKSSGYIVQGYSSITIDGWRTSDKDVATFYFSSPEGSYRKRMEKGNNLGVIGVAVIAEKPQQTITYNWCNGHCHGNCHNCWPWVTTYTTTSDSTFTSGTSINLSATNTAGGIFSASSSDVQGSNDAMQVKAMYANSGSQPTQQLGTGWGEQKRSEVTTVSFDREDSPEAVFEIHYNTREQLEAAGVNFKKEPLYVTPQAFPGQYCKPPQD